jgi:hypothetical protein
VGRGQLVYLMGLFVKQMNEERGLFKEVRKKRLQYMGYISRIGKNITCNKCKRN